MSALDGDRPALRLKEPMNSMSGLEVETNHAGRGVAEVLDFSYLHNVITSSENLVKICTMH